MAQPIPIGPFAGVNLVNPRADQLSQCLNLRLNELGQPEKRPGHKGYGSSPEKVNGDVHVNLLHRYYTAGGIKELIAAAGGKLKKGNDSTGAWTQINIDGSAGNNMEATLLASRFVYKDRLYIADGTRPQRYNGTDNVYAGHFIPVITSWVLTGSTNAPTGSGLTLLGVYQYKMSIVAGTMGEGPKSVAKSITLTGTQNRVTVGAGGTLDSAPATHEASAKKLYRTKAGGTIFYYLAEIAAGATSYVDDIADSALLTAEIASHVPPADARFAVLSSEERVYWFGRAGANASLVDVSDVGFPDRILDTDFFAIANNDGDILTGGGRVPGGVIFTKRRSTWLMRAFGYPPIQLSDNVGSVSPFSIVAVPGGVIYLSQEGKVYFARESKPDEIGEEVMSEFVGMTGASLARVAASYHDGRYIIAYDYRGTKGYNSKVLEYDVLRQRWEGPHENGSLITPSYFATWDSERDNGELSWGEARAAAGSYVYIRDEFTKLDNATSKFISTYKTGKTLFSHRNNKKFHKAFVRGEVSSDAQVTISVIDDVGAEVGADMFAPTTIGGNDLIWGTGNWGDKNWAGSSRNQGEGSFVPKVKARNPEIKVTDKGSATSLKIDEVELLVESLPLK